MTQFFPLLNPYFHLFPPFSRGMISTLTINFSPLSFSHTLIKFRRAVLLYTLFLRHSFLFFSLPFDSFHMAFICGLPIFEFNDKQCEVRTDSFRPIITSSLLIFLLNFPLKIFGFFTSLDIESLNHWHESQKLLRFDENIRLKKQ